MKQVKIFGITVAILLLCMAGGVCESHAASVRGAAEGEVKVFEGNREQLPSIHSIEADLTDLDLKIVSTEKQKSSLSYSIYCKNSKNPLTYSVKNGVLYLKETGIKKLSNKEKKQKIGKKWWEYWPKVTLYVSADTVIKNSRVNMTEGDLAIGKKIHCKDMNVQVKNGDIALSAIQVSGTAKINAVEGDIAAAGSVVSGNMQITTKYGDIAAVALKVSGKLQINSTDGDIVLHLDKKGFNSLAATVSAKYGDILVLGKMRGGTKKSKGDGWYYEKKGTGKGRLKIVTKEGDILLK